MRWAMRTCFHGLSALLSQLPCQVMDALLSLTRLNDTFFGGFGRLMPPVYTPQLELLVPELGPFQ